MAFLTSLTRNVNEGKFQQLHIKQNFEASHLTNHRDRRKFGMHFLHFCLPKTESLYIFQALPTYA